MGRLGELRTQGVAVAAVVLAVLLLAAFALPMAVIAIAVQFGFIDEVQ